MRFIKSLSLALITFSITVSKSLVGGDSLFEYGTTVGDVETAPNDDGSGPELTLPEKMFFFSEDGVTKVYQNTNGLISFEDPVATYNALQFPSTEFPRMIAAYWTDIDTRSGGDGNKLYARTTTRQEDIDIALPLIKNCTNSLYCKDATDFEPKFSSVFSYVQVNPYTIDQDTTQTNSFQVGLIYDELKTWVVLSYENITFFDPESSSNSSIIGFNHEFGIGNSTYLLSNVTSTSMMQDLMSSSNCGRAGVYVYNVYNVVPETIGFLPFLILEFIFEAIGSVFNFIFFCF